MELLNEVNNLIDRQEIVQSLQAIAEKYPNEAVFSTSFSYEDQIISHLILTNEIPIEIFTLDTGRLFKETHQVLNTTNKRYKTKVKVYFPNYEEVENLVNEKGNYSFYQSLENRKECCFIRKVQPLNRAVKDKKVWITGIRAEHSANRQEMTQTEWDEGHQLVKYHPLLDWTTEQVENFVKENHVPYNVLHDQDFPSIGCEPCTRAIKPGEDMRAGRWWWENPEGKECGLHEVNEETEVRGEKTEVG